MIKVGDKVTWRWGSGTAEGEVKERFDRRVQRTLKGTRVVKNGTPDRPEVLIEQEDGTKVLKHASELQQGSRR
jgi:hypothetical protein